MRIAILTGGGDVPGLNACLKAAVERIVDAGHQPIGVRRGFGGLVAIDPDDPASVQRNLVDLDRAAVRTIDRTGGTVLHTSRIVPGAVPHAEAPPALARTIPGNGPYDLTDHIIAVVEHLQLDGLIAIGGDETLAAALELHRRGVPVIGVPKTMDNDVGGTDYCLGFSTAVSRSVELIHQLRTSVGSHERIAVIELFGRRSGETSLVAAYLASVDRAVIPEVGFDPERLAALLMEDRRRNPSRYALVTVSEGAHVEPGSPHAERVPVSERERGGVGTATASLMRELTGEEIVSQGLGYLMRSGRPDSLDLMVAFNFGTLAAELALDEQAGRMVALDGGVYTDVPLEKTADGARRVDVDALYDRDAYRPKVREVAGKPMFLY